MTIYGEWKEQFRPQPKIHAVVLFCGGLLLSAMALAAILTAVAQSTATESRTVDGAFPVYAPYAQKLVIFRPGPHAGAVRDVIAPAFDIVAAALVVLLLPTATTLAARMSTHLLTVALVLHALSRALELPMARWLEGELSIIGLWRPATLVAAALILHWSELRRNELLTNIDASRTPAHRLRWWTYTYLGPLLLIALIAWSSNYLPMALAVLIASGIMLLSNISTRPRERVEKLAEIEMREAAVTAPVVALIVVGACLWLFGLPRLGLPNRALLFGGAHTAALQPTTAVNILTAADEAQQKKAAEEAKKKKSVIDIHWSGGK